MNVKQGAKFLDENGPTNWRQIIESESLDMLDCEACILGQLYGSFYGGRTKLGIGLASSEMYGFFIRESDSLPEWDALTEAWKEEIAS